MAKQIPDLIRLTRLNVSEDDVFVIHDVSENTTKKITTSDIINTRSFQSISEVENNAIDKEDFIDVEGYYSPNDGGKARYVYRASEPSHPGKIQSSDGKWWELSENVANPKMFGAKWDNVTDDTVSVNNFADYIRATQTSGVFLPGKCYLSDTVFLGGCKITGSNGTTFDPADPIQSSSTILRCAGNPAVALNVKGAAKSWPCNLSDFDIVSSLSEGAQHPNPINLLFYANYPYQIGIWGGRSFEFLSFGDPIRDGSGFGSLNNVNVIGFGGWGKYFHYAWGQSLAFNGFCRRNGSAAAYHLDDDRLGGNICFDNVGVDWKAGNYHMLQWGHDDPVYDRRGTALRLGSDTSEMQAAATALGKTLVGYPSGGNVSFKGLHVEQCQVGLDARAGNDARLENMKLECKRVYLGSRDFPFGQGVIKMDGIVVSAQAFEGPCLIEVTSPGLVDLGKLDTLSGRPVIISYTGSLTLDRFSGRLQQNNTPPSSTIRGDILLRPDHDQTGHLAGSNNFVPWIGLHHSDPEAAHPSSNLIPEFPSDINTGGFTAVIEEEGLVARDGPNELRIGGAGAFAVGRIEYAATGLQGGQLYSFGFNCPETIGRQDWRFLSYGITSASGLLRGDKKNGSWTGEHSRTFGSLNSRKAGEHTGTVTINSGSSVLTGIGTRFLSEARVGEVIILDSTNYTVGEIDSDTELTLTIPYTNANLSGAIAKYPLGTVSIDQYSRTVTGVNTRFGVDTRVGSIITLGGGNYRVAQPISDTELLLVDDYMGTSLSGSAPVYPLEEPPLIKVSKIINFVAPPDGNVTVFIERQGFNQIVISDMTLVRGALQYLP